MFRKLSIDALEVRALLAATVLADLFPGLGSSNPEFIGTLGGELYYSARTPDGQKLFSTDGFTVSERATVPDGAQSRQIRNAIYFTVPNEPLRQFTLEKGMLLLVNFPNPTFVGDTPYNLHYEQEVIGEINNQMFIQRWDYLDIDMRQFTYEVAHQCVFGGEPCNQSNMHYVLDTLAVLEVHEGDVIVSVFDQDAPQVTQYLASGAHDMWIALPGHGMPVQTDGAPLLDHENGLYTLSGELVVDDIAYFSSAHDGSLLVSRTNGELGRISSGEFSVLYVADTQAFFSWGISESLEGVMIALDNVGYILGADESLTPWQGGAIFPSLVIHEVPGVVAYLSDTWGSNEIDRIFRTGGYDLRRVGDRFVFADFDPMNGNELMVRDMVPGDADLDGVFDSGDLVDLFASGKYEADVDASWLQGDFNGDGRFNSADLIEALASGMYTG